MAKAKRKQQKSLSETLDPAVMAAFPGVECETSYCLFTGRMVTRWWRKGTEDEPLPADEAARVRDFVSGFMARDAQEDK